MVLTDPGQKNGDMLEFLYRDRIELAVYSKAACGLAFHKLREKQKLAMTMQNLSQYLVHDNENQTAYLRPPRTTTGGTGTAPTSKPTRSTSSF